MHWVDRGPEPERLASSRAKKTPAWIRYYRDRSNPRPTDSDWRNFCEELEQAFSGLCGYCEEICKGEVDHYRPKSRFPELVYQWSNWILACHSCNNLKGEKWPPHGYVDPCAKSRSARPEHFFTFDTLTGEILAKPGLGPVRRAKAIRMIDELGLNRLHNLKRRVSWLWLVTQTLANCPPTHPAHAPILKRIVSRTSRLSSVTRTLLAQKGWLTG